MCTHTHDLFSFSSTTCSQSFSFSLSLYLALSLYLSFSVSQSHLSFLSLAPNCTYFLCCKCKQSFLVFFISSFIEIEPREKKAARREAKSLQRFNKEKLGQQKSLVVVEKTFFSLFYVILKNFGPLLRKEVSDKLEQSLP